MKVQKFGVEFAVGGRPKLQVISLSLVEGRLITFKVLLIYDYAPAEEKIDMTSTWNALISAVSSRSQIALCDFNTRVDKGDIFGVIVEKFSLHYETFSAGLN